jgi:hypothetical protein
LKALEAFTNNPVFRRNVGTLRKWSEQKVIEDDRVVLDGAGKDHLGLDSAWLLLRNPERCGDEDGALGLVGELEAVFDGFGNFKNARKLYSIHHRSDVVDDSIALIVKCRVRNVVFAVQRRRCGLDPAPELLVQKSVLASGPVDNGGMKRWWRARKSFLEEGTSQRQWLNTTKRRCLQCKTCSLNSAQRRMFNNFGRNWVPHPLNSVSSPRDWA